MRKPEVFDNELQELANFAKVISHPSRLANFKVPGRDKNLHFVRYFGSIATESHNGVAAFKRIARHGFNSWRN